MYSIVHLCETLEELHARHTGGGGAIEADGRLTSCLAPS
jgi:hypothetical protein